MIEIEVFTEGTASIPADGITGDFFREIGHIVFSYTETDNVHVAIIITDDLEIQKINSEFRGKDKPTDVISFAYRDEPFPINEGIAEELGDLYISIDTARRQADEYGVTLADELKRLTIHGILHLLGYDHEKSEEDESIMMSLEDKLFNLK